MVKMLMTMIIASSSCFPIGQQDYFPRGAAYPQPKTSTPTFSILSFPPPSKVWAVSKFHISPRFNLNFAANSKARQPWLWKQSTKFHQEYNTNKYFLIIQGSGKQCFWYQVSKSSWILRDMRKSREGCSQKSQNRLKILRKYIKDHQLSPKWQFWPILCTSVFLKETISSLIDFSSQYTIDEFDAV